MHRLLVTLCLTLLVVAAGATAAMQVNAPARVSYLAYERAQPILESFKADLPAELRDALSGTPATAWTKWAASRDRDIRARLNQGDEDSVVNYLLFGTTF